MEVGANEPNLILTTCTGTLCAILYVDVSKAHIQKAGHFIKSLCY